MAVSTLRFVLTEEEFIAVTGELAAAKLRAVATRALVLGIANVVGGALLLSIAPVLAGICFGIGGVLLLTLAFIPGRRRQSMQRLWQSEDLLRSEKSVSFGDDEIVLVSDLQTIHRKWQMAASLRRRGELYVFMTEASRPLLIVPRRAFATPEDVTTFEGMASMRLGAVEVVQE